MGDIVDLAARRSPSAREHLACECGSEWFHLDGRATGLDTDAGAVVLDRDSGRIVAYCGVPMCAECGKKPSCWP